MDIVRITQPTENYRRPRAVLSARTMPATPADKSPWLNRFSAVPEQCRSVKVSRTARPPHRGYTMIERLVPMSACAEMFSDVPESAMFSIEAAMVEGAVAERRREYGTVRYCARQALQQIGVPAVPVLRDLDGAPRWPTGVVGSMTHCVGYRAAAVARTRDVRAIGIDAEPHAAVPEPALDLILRDEERARLSSLADACPDLHWDRIVFCAKEAVYKAWFPLTRRWLDFTDVSVMPRRDGTFRAYLRTQGPDVAGFDLDAFDGRWMVGRGLVLAAVSIMHCRPVRTSNLDGFVFQA